MSKGGVFCVRHSAPHPLRGNKLVRLQGILKDLRRLAEQFLHLGELDCSNTRSIPEKVDVLNQDSDFFLDVLRLFVHFKLSKKELSKCQEILGRP